MNSSASQEFDNCVSSVVSYHIFFSWFTSYLLLIPVFLFVLYLGFSKWMSSRSSASGGLSHSDVFTLNMITMEMSSIVGCGVTLYGYLSLNKTAVSFGGDTVLSTRIGQALFHSLTCVERYLAVVHPVTYLSLRGGGGVTVRNVCIAFVWAFSVIYTLLCRFIKLDLFYVLSVFLLYMALLPVVVYCSVYVLCVLIRPKPGERGGRRKHVDQSKRSTVYTIVVILGVLLLRLITDVTYNSLFLYRGVGFDRCVLSMSSAWLSLPSSLVLPLLFLYRAGKLSGCR